MSIKDTVSNLKAEVVQAFVDLETRIENLFGAGNKGVLTAPIIPADASGEAVADVVEASATSDAATAVDADASATVAA